MNTAHIDPRFPDLAKAQQALMRAAERARQLAEQTGTRLIVRPPAGQPAPRQPR